MEHNDPLRQAEVDTSPEMLAALAKLSAVGQGGDPLALLTQAMEELGKRINPEDILIEYEDDGKGGKRIKPVDALMGSGWIIKIRPLNWQQSKRYKLRDHEVFDWDDEDKIRLIYENLVFPDLVGESGAQSLEEFSEWIGVRLGWADVDDFALTIVKFSHSRMRRLRLVPGGEEDAGKETTPSDSLSESQNAISSS